MRCRSGASSAQGRVGWCYGIAVGATDRGGPAVPTGKASCGGIFPSHLVAAGVGRFDLVGFAAE